MSISAVSDTPTAPFGGVTVADSIWPTRVRFAVAVCPATTCADPEPASAVLGTLAVRVTAPGKGGDWELPAKLAKATKRKPSPLKKPATGAEEVGTGANTNPVGAVAL